MPLARASTRMKPADDRFGRSGYVIRAPRVTDAMAPALKQAFGKSPGAKTELMSLLRALDEID